MTQRLAFLLTLLLTLPATAQLELAVATTTYELTGGLSTLQTTSPYSPVIDRYSIHSDAVLRSDGCWLFAVNRFSVDNVLTLNACDGYSVQTQFSVGNGSNPHDILVVGIGRAYVTRYESDLLWIVDYLNGSKLGEIDLGAFADADGLPEMSQMASFGRYAFVGLQNLDRNSFFASTGTSQLAVIDTESDALVDVDPVAPGIQTIALQLQNPFWRMRVHPGLSRLVLISSGDFAVLDGGVELVNPHNFQSDAVVLSETALGGDILDAVIVDANLGYVLYSDATFATKVNQFDPSTGTLGASVVQTTGFELSDLELTDEGVLYVGDRRAAAPGIRAYDAATGVELTTGAVSVGLPPFDIEPVRTAAVTAPSPRAAARLSASPNVFARSTTLSLDGWELATLPAVEIVDLRGRRLRSLQPRDGRYVWDGRDAAGNSVAAGKYWAVVSGRPQLRAAMVLHPGGG